MFERPDHEDPEMGQLMEASAAVVPFYLFHTAERHPYNGRICVILDRAGLDPSDTEPMFKVQFNNGQIEEVLASELRPWFPAR